MSGEPKGISGMATTAVVNTSEAIKAAMMSSTL